MFFNNCCDCMSIRFNCLVNVISVFEGEITNGCAFEFMVNFGQVCLLPKRKLVHDVFGDVNNGGVVVR